MLAVENIYKPTLQINTFYVEKSAADLLNFHYYHLSKEISAVFLLIQISVASFECHSLLLFQVKKNIQIVKGLQFLVFMILSKKHPQALTRKPLAPKRKTASIKTQQMFHKNCSLKKNKKHFHT